jgi:transcriptional regulator with XRE-family HTH domain
MEKKAMGERLQKLREEAGMSQSQLARAAGLPLTTLRNWEQGRRVPLLDNALRVAKALGVTVDHLAGEGGKNEPPAPKRRKGR